MLHLQQPALLRIGGGRLAILAAAVVLPMALGVEVMAQTASAPCYEVIPAQARIEPPVPMLVDKCSGRTWLLVRAGRGAYRWAAVATDGDRPKAMDRPVTDVQPAKKESDPQKCFTFNNRKFCE